MARKIVTVDESLRLPPEVEDALKGDLESNFEQTLLAAEVASGQAQGAAAAAQQAAENAEAPTDEMVSDLMNDPESLTHASTIRLIQDNVDETDVGYDIIVLLGQSNMVGRGLPLDPVAYPGDPRVFQFASQGDFANTIVPATNPLMHWGSLTQTTGPAMTFGRLYARTIHPNRKVLFVPAAQGATAFSGSVRVWKVTHTPEHENLYLRAVAQTEKALAAAGPNSRIVGFLWHQGEGGSGDPSYPADLDELITSIRGHFGVPDAWFILGQMSPAGNVLSSSKIIGNGVHIDTPRRNYHSAFAYAAYGLHNDDDTTHFSSEGVDYLGRSYFAALPLAKANDNSGLLLPPPGPMRRLYGAPDTLHIEWQRPECRFTNFVVQHRLAGTETWTTTNRGTNNLDSRDIITGYTYPDNVEVRVATVNESGTSEFSDIKTFQPMPYLSDIAPSMVNRYYALRKIKRGYTGNCIRVWRASDNTTLEVGFDSNGNLDEEAIRTFCAGTDGYVRAWYSQGDDPSGLSGMNDFTVLPKIVANGTILKQNGRPVMAFDGVDDYLYANNAVARVNPNNTFLFAVSLASDTTNTSGRIWAEGNSGTDTPWYSLATTGTPTAKQTDISFGNRNDANVVKYTDLISGVDQIEKDGVPSDKSFVLWAARYGPNDNLRISTPTRRFDPVSTGGMGTTTTDRTSVGILRRSGANVTNPRKMRLTEFGVWHNEYWTMDQLAPVWENIRQYLSLDHMTNNPW